MNSRRVASVCTSSRTFSRSSTRPTEVHLPSPLATPLERFAIHVCSPVRGTYREQEVGPATTLPVLSMLAYGRTPLSHAERVLGVLRAQSTPRRPSSLLRSCLGGHLIYVKHGAQHVDSKDKPFCQ